MDLSRARGVALLTMAAVAAALVLVVGTSDTADAARRAAPTVLSLRQTSPDTVRVAGRTAKRKARVRIDRKTGAGWDRVKTVRSKRHRYATRLAVQPGTTAKFRLTSNRRSRTFRVSVPEVESAPSIKKAPSTKPGKTPKPAYDDCGLRPQKADGSLWACTFVDEFWGTELDRTKWMPNAYFVTFSGTTPACYRDDPANVNVADGVLNLTLVKLDEPAACSVKAGPTQYMAGSVTTHHLFSQQYGRYEVRFKTEATNLPGLHEAIWLWPDDRYSTVNWPDSGEIDLAESFSAYPSIVGSYLHYSLDHSGLFFGVNAANCAANRGEWNTIALEWSASRLETFLNGKSCLVNTSGDAAFQKRYVINLTQAIGGGTWNQLHEDLTYPSTMKVDYVHVWK